MKHEKIGLALGGGSARGWAHIGVFRALAEADIQIDCVAGTSIGALVGAIYASGRIALLEEAVLKMDWGRIVSFLDVVFPRSGLIDGKKIETFFRGHVQKTHFEDLRLPFAAVATDLRSGSAVVLKSGDLIEAVRASISIPGIFTPVVLDGRVLVDGGLVDPVPVTVARSLGADRVIAVDLSHSLTKKPPMKTGGGSLMKNEDTEEKQMSVWLTHLRKELNQRAESVHPMLSKQINIGRNDSATPSIYDVLGTSIGIMEVRITETNFQIDPPDLVIRPEFDNFMFLDFHRAKEAIEAGYSATLVALETWK